MKVSRATFGVAVGIIVVIVFSGCVPWPFSAFTDRAGVSGASTAAPSAAPVGPGLSSFYAQRVAWSACSDGFECATVTAPLNWQRPAQGAIELALIRKRATGAKLGSLLVNPGGPGASGYDIVRSSLGHVVRKPLQRQFDIVGFDPRGVGRSSSVSCVSDAEKDAYLFDLVAAPRGSDKWIADVRASTKNFGQACLAKTGDLLTYIDTVSSARDLDLLRAVLGDAKLNYLGYSYGTYLGATYASLYPTNVGRLVLDGALDPSVSGEEVSKQQAIGFEKALTAYLTDCPSRRGCPFKDTVTSSLADIRKLLESVDASPIAARDGRKLGANTLLIAIVYPLYSKEAWPYLDQLFESVKLGGAEDAFMLADQYYSRNSDGTYSDNSAEAFQAINCLDYTYQSDVAVMRQGAADIEQAAPTIGKYMGYGDLSCIDWPVKSAQQQGSITAPGAAPILVIGTTGDPATPYQWAVSLAKQLSSGILLTYEGEGHTAYTSGNGCVAGLVESYFLTGATPAVGTRC